VLVLKNRTGRPLKLFDLHRIFNFKRPLSKLLLEVRHYEKSDFSLDNLLFFLYTETSCIGNDLPQYYDVFVAKFVEGAGILSVEIIDWSRPMGHNVSETRRQNS